MLLNASVERLGTIPPSKAVAKYWGLWTQVKVLGAKEE